MYILLYRYIYTYMYMHMYIYICIYIRDRIKLKTNSVNQSLFYINITNTFTWNASLSKSRQYSTKGVAITFYRQVHLFDM